MHIELILSHSSVYSVITTTKRKKETLGHMPLSCNLTDLLRQHLSVTWDLYTVSGTNLTKNLTIYGLLVVFQSAFSAYILLSKSTSHYRTMVCTGV
jgi:hypothetical protein